MIKALVLFILSMGSLSIAISSHSSSVNVVFILISMVSILACEKTLDNEYIKYHEEKKFLDR